MSAPGGVEFTVTLEGAAGTADSAFVSPDAFGFILTNPASSIACHKRELPRIVILFRVLLHVLDVGACGLNSGHTIPDGDGLQHALVVGDKCAVQTL